MMSKPHGLKILPTHFEQIRAGTKTAEVRLNDRDYQVGDTLLLSEYAYNFFTMRVEQRKISCVTDLSGLKPEFEGYVLLSFETLRVLWATGDEAQDEKNDAEFLREIYAKRDTDAP